MVGRRQQPPVVRILNRRRRLARREVHRRDPEQLGVAAARLDHRSLRVAAAGVERPLVYADARFQFVGPHLADGVGGHVEDGERVGILQVRYLGQAVDVHVDRVGGAGQLHVDGLACHHRWRQRVDQHPRRTAGRVQAEHLERRSRLQVRDVDGQPVEGAQRQGRFAAVVVDAQFQVVGAGPQRRRQHDQHAVRHQRLRSVDGRRDPVVRRAVGRRSAEQHPRSDAYLVVRPGNRDAIQRAPSLPVGFAATVVPPPPPPMAVTSS